MITDTPVFDLARELPPLLDAKDGWSPPRVTGPRGIPVFRFGSDGPSEEHRIDAGKAWYSSGRFSGQAANDNIDWPLAKLLRAEGNDYLLKLAERYRDMWNAANMPRDLVGRHMANNIYLMADMRLDSASGDLKNKGLKKVVGKKARLDEAPKRSVAADPDKTKKRAKPIPKPWQGDWPLLHAIDCSRQLVEVQTALGPIRAGFEAAVVSGETLEAVGRDHGVGNKTGAKGAGRALVYLGLQTLDEFWLKPMRRAA
jgi:hypothetical protein